MKKLLIYVISLTILVYALVLSYKYVQSRLNPKQPAQPRSRLENCQNLKVNDPKLIAFANKCLIEAGGRISDFTPDHIRRFTEAEKKRVGLETPDEWVVSYRSKKGRIWGGYSVRINVVTCECIADQTSH